MEAMDHLKRLLERYPALVELKNEISESYELMKKSYENGGKLLVCGNGGSAADSDHIVGELMKGFYKERRLPGEEQKKYGDLEKEQSLYQLIVFQITEPVSYFFQTGSTGKAAFFVWLSMDGGSNAYTDHGCQHIDKQRRL